MYSQVSYDEYTDRTLSMGRWDAHCHWEDETVSERTGHPPSYAEAKKTKSLTLHSHGCPMASLKRPIFFFFFVSLLVPG